MSFDLLVYVPAFPVDIKTRWERQLAAEGLLCEFPPEFNPVTWAGGYLPVEFLAPSHYGSSPIFVSFEFWTERHNGIEIELEARTPGLDYTVLARPGWRCFLGTGFGRSVADLRLQSFAAATLAMVTGGVVSDPQQGRDFLGQDAIANAAAESASYEKTFGEPSIWKLEAWPGWAACGYSQASGAASARRCAADAAEDDMTDPTSPSPAG